MVRLTGGDEGLSSEEIGSTWGVLYLIGWPFIRVCVSGKLWVYRFLISLVFLYYSKHRVIENFTNVIIGTLVLFVCFGKRLLRKSAMLGLIYGIVRCLKTWKIWRCFKVGIEVGILNVA